MTTQNDDSVLREKLASLKPHTKEQLPLGDLLSHKELDAILQAVAAHYEGVVEKAVIAYRDDASTNGRPLSAEPLVIEQPVPCTRCKATHYADWNLWPHQMYNKYADGGTGHYCFECYATIVAELKANQATGGSV